MSFRRRLLLLFLFASAVPLGIAVAVHSVSFYRSAKEAALRQLGESASQTARRLDDFLLAAARDFGSIAADGHHLEGRPDDLSGHLAKYTYAFPCLKEVLWVGAGGAILAASDRQLAGHRLAERHPELDDELAEVTRGPAGQLRVSDLDDVSPAVRAGIEQGRLGQDALELQFLMRVDNPRGEFLGVLVGTIGTKIIADILDEVAHGTPDALPVVLLGRRGEVLVSTAAGARVLARHALAPDEAGGEAGVLTMAARNESGESVLAALGSMRGFGKPRAGDWRVLLQVRESTVTGVVWRTLGTSAAAMAVLLAIAVSIGLSLSQAIASRIDLLVRASQEAAGGKFSARVPAQGSDELADLARAFNATLSEVEASHARIKGELVVRERAGAELAAAYRRLETQNRETTLRNEMGDLLQSCINTDEAGAVIARFVPALFAGASGAVYLHVSGCGTLAAVASWGAEGMATAIELTDCWALRRGRAHLMTAGGDALPCAHVAAPLAGALLCVPLAAHGETLGLLHLACPDACRVGEATMQERQLLAEALAAQIGMALANLRLRDSLREQSIRDALTGLFNRRYLEESLDRELARARREGRSLAVFMLDVDHFKRFNDSCGHEAGDAVLRALGHALRDNARAGDLPCRFGGEEFTAVLPGATLESAREWGERLMERVRRMEVRTGGQTLPTVTVSLGLALYPEHGSDRETLLQAADLALYDAKHAGRDRLAVSGEGA